MYISFRHSKKNWWDSMRTEVDTFIRPKHAILTASIGFFQTLWRTGWINFIIKIREKVHTYFLVFFFENCRAKGLPVSHRNHHLSFTGCIYASILCKQPLSPCILCIWQFLRLEDMVRQLIIYVEAECRCQLGATEYWLEKTLIPHVAWCGNSTVYLSSILVL